MPPKKKAGGQDGRVGERGPQIGLLEHDDQWHTHKKEGLEDVKPGQSPPAQVGKVAGHGQNQDQLDHSEGWK